MLLLSLSRFIITEGVDEAACMGIPDEEWGRKPVAIMVVKKGSSASPEEMMEHWR